MVETERKRQIYKVGQVNRYIRTIFDGDFILKDISVTGEISNCKYHHSGHIYFSLKDETGVISCIMFSSDANKLAFKMEDGMQVVISGNISVYEAAGHYQLYARKAETAGDGDLFKKIEELKKKLDGEGLFAKEHKKTIPLYASKIGVVTAETGAVIRDIFNVSKRRNPYVQIYLYPAKVQGDGAADEIVSGIKKLDGMNLDTIIIGRGGGSIEDLMAFNDENVARAIYDCNTPLISAVGHETDFTIADFVADERAPTPSAAAEIAVFDYDLFEKEVNDYRYTFETIIKNKINMQVEKAEKYRLMLENLSPSNKLLQKKHKLSDASAKLEYLAESKLTFIKNKLEDASRQLNDNAYNKILFSKNRLSLISERLSGLSPLKRLAEGYAFVTINEKKLVSIKQADVGDDVSINVKDGYINACIKEKGEVEYG